MKKIFIVYIVLITLVILLALAKGQKREIVCEDYAEYTASEIPVKCLEHFGIGGVIK